jgi:hypothetical protein
VLVFAYFWLHPVLFVSPSVLRSEVNLGTLDNGANLFWPT